MVEGRKGRDWKLHTQPDKRWEGKKGQKRKKKKKGAGITRCACLSERTQPTRMSGLWTPLRSALRMAVSGDKQRFDDGQVNLDLSYITDRIIGLLSHFVFVLFLLFFLLSFSHDNQHNMTNTTFPTP